jgi:DNA-directed RNA polymerase specialized sigma24 family protein
MRADHQALVQRASSGDALAIGNLMQHHLPGLLAFVRANAGHWLRAREGSFDLVQSACREVLQDLSACSSLDEAGFRRWLYLAAERKILDRARYHAREKRGAGRDAHALSDVEVQALSQGYGDLARVPMSSPYPVATAR